MKFLYPSVQEIASSNDTDFIKSAPYNWMYGFGHSPAYVSYSIIWETLYYDGFISKSEYDNNPFPL